MTPASSLDYRAIPPEGPLYEAERDLRNRILLHPLGLPDGAWEMKDSSSFHVVALDGANPDQPVVGCVLLAVTDGQSSGQLLQMAVESGQQRGGIGTRLVEKLLEIARTEGLSDVFCHSREDAVPFYEKLGFVPEGEPFIEVGVPHTVMRTRLV